jgi:hypothetical protein
VREGPGQTIVGDTGWRPPGGRPSTLHWWTCTIVRCGALGTGLAAPILDLGEAHRSAYSAKHGYEGLA